MNYVTKVYLFMILIHSITNGQHFISADPSKLFKYEKEQFVSQENQQSLMIRPIKYNSIGPKWMITIKNEFFFNDNGPNLENMGNRWVGKGAGYFSGLKFSYLSNFLALTIEPYYYFNQNKYTKNKDRFSPYGSEHPNIFNVLNDNRIHLEKPYKLFGLRESQLYFYYKQFAIGISNANMWWGPGIHTSLTMTNNTSGFPHLMIGTLSEKRFQNMGINFRYIFTQLNEVRGDPYYTSLVSTARFYTNPIITIGFSRNYLSGGLPTDRPFNSLDAALLPFESLFIDSKMKNYSPDWEAHDRWDETMAGFATMEFPKSQLKLFIEIGTDDHRQNWMDLRSQPDHNSASIIGLRKYGFFHNQLLLGGFEYANIKQTYTSKFRGGGHWWWKDYYDYSTYDGRRWAAHSGSDSDDFFLYFGYQDSHRSFIPSVNYERRGIITGNFPEVKIELRLDLGFVYREFHINVYFERELIINSEFQSDRKLTSNLLWFGVEKYLTSDFSNIKN